MADVTATQFQQDVNNFSEVTNGDESTTVAMRLGQQVDSVAKTINDIKIQADTAINESAKNFSFTDAGFDFATGGVIETANQLVKDDSDQYWQWQGSLPHTVTAGTVPSSPDWEIKVFNQASNIVTSSGDSAQDYFDATARVYQSIQSMISETALTNGDNFVCNGYYSSGDGNTSIYRWDETLPKSNHDGGKILSPTVPFNSTGDFREGIGETDPSGNGCFVLKETNFGINCLTYGMKKTLDYGYENSFLVPQVYCWGDSLTAGTGGTPYPTTMALISAFSSCNNSGVGGETSTEIKDRFLADSATDRRTVIIWVGRNNIDDVATIISDIDTMVNKLRHSRFLVLSVLNSDSEPSGSARHDKALEIRDRLSKRYPLNFYDIREYLIQDGLDDAGITPTAQDLIDISNDIVPTSLRSDGIHLNTDGYNLVAEKVKENIINVIKNMDEFDYFHGVLSTFDGKSGAIIGQDTPVKATLNGVKIANTSSGSQTTKAIELSGNFASLQTDANFAPKTNNLYDLGLSSIRWRNAYFTGEIFAATIGGGTGNFTINASQVTTGSVINMGAGSGARIIEGTGFPEGVTTAGVGSIYLRTGAAVGSRLWKKDSGTGNTGWVAIDV